jgi:hypothetical protein
MVILCCLKSGFMKKRIKNVDDGMGWARVNLSKISILMEKKQKQRWFVTNVA